jgi:hypothetical protein
VKLLSCLVIATGICTIIPSESYSQARGYFGRAHCAVTGATGSAQAASAKAAREGAIAQCIGNGGIPKCCRRGSSVSPQ